MFFIGNRFKKNICLFLNPIVELLWFCLYMSVIPIQYVYTKQILLQVDTSMSDSWLLSLDLLSCFNKYVGWEIYTRQAADYWTSSVHIWECYAQSRLLHLPHRSLYTTQCNKELPIPPVQHHRCSYMHLYTIEPLDVSSQSISLL
jgi:hypothetical protein